MKSILIRDANKLVIAGPGGVKMQLSPGSQILQFEQSQSGHMPLPVTRFRSKPAGSRIVFTVSENPADTPPWPPSESNVFSEVADPLPHTWPAGLQDSQTPLPRTRATAAEVRELSRAMLADRKQAGATSSR